MIHFKGLTTYRCFACKAINSSANLKHTFKVISIKIQQIIEYCHEPNFILR